jgi:putative aldouronate transport system substrate-binding protein
MKSIRSITVLLLLVGVFLLGASTFAAAPYEIKWYFIGNGQQPDVKMVEDAASKYIQKKGLNATVKLQCYTWGDDYNNHMRTIIASGEPFDICFTSSWANLYTVNVGRGAFLDITDLWKKYAPKSRAQLHPSFITASQVNGRNYAIPANKEVAHAWCIMFTKEFVDKYKFDISSIKKLADLEPMLKVIHEKEPGVIGFQNIGGENASRVLDYDRPIGDQVPAALYNDSKDMKVFNMLETKEFKEYCELVHKWYQAGYIPTDAANMTNDFVGDIKAHKVFCKIESYKPYADEERSASWGLPQVAVQLTRPVAQTYDCIGSMQAIPKSCKKPEMALKFLELFNTDKYLNNLINFGIEGKHYVKIADNVIDKVPGKTAENNGYQPGTPWMFGNQYLNYFYKGEHQDKWDLFKKFNESSLAAKSQGFSFDAEPVKNEIAACQNVWNTYVLALVTGTVDPATIPDVVAKFKAAGVDKVIAEEQKQLDAWLAKKK